MRWTTGVSTPRPSSIPQLLDAFAPYPELYETFNKTFAKREYSSDHPRDARIHCIPGPVYEELLKLSATFEGQRRTWKICEHLINALLAQLDPTEVGMAALVIQCTFPAPGRQVRSLNILYGQATPFSWENQLRRETPVLLGIESLSGYSVSSYRLQKLQKEQLGILPGLSVSDMNSAIACPILFGQQIAGCLYLCSRLKDTFKNPQCTLAEAYADALALAFEPHAFFSNEQIHLEVFPSQHKQQEVFAKIQLQTLRYIRQQALSSSNTEQFILQQLEEELLAKTAR